MLGLDLVAWQPVEEAIPREVFALVEEREQARREKRWPDADALRDQVRDLGYEIEDTGQASTVRLRG